MPLSDGAGLSALETVYYPQWMSVAGVAEHQAWSKRRAMFWGLLTANDVESAYCNGETIAQRIGRPKHSRWSSSPNVRAWFFRKGAIANLFNIEIAGPRFTLTPRRGDPWAVALQGLATAMVEGTGTRNLPKVLPSRPPLDALSLSEAEARTRELFRGGEMPALLDVLADVSQPDAREFRLAVLRSSRDDAFFWYQREWSFRAKERFRSEVHRRQQGRCACCTGEDLALELNHVQKVRDFGRTVADNLEGLCRPCHTSIDKRGARCHSDRSPESPRPQATPSRGA